MSFAQPESRDSESRIVNCKLLHGKACVLCKEHINLEPEFIEAQAQLLEAEKALNSVKAKRQLIRTKINHEHDRLTRRLPIELVAEIFKATLTRRVMPGMTNFIIDSPLFLGAVCQKWRRIAWSTPFLWNWIHILLRLPVSEHFEELLEEWLERSGRLPLTIQISSGEGVIDAENPDIFFPGDDKVFGNFVDHVNACSSRWEYVSFTVPGTIRSFLTGSVDGSPDLKMLRVCTTDSYDYSFGLEKMVRPSHLVFGGYPWTWDEMNIAFDNLVDIYFTQFDTHLCAKAIKQMPRLIRCVLVDVCEEHGLDDLVTNQRFTHQNLEHLTFTARNQGPRARSLFDYFLFPNLTHLRIICLDDSEGFYLSGLTLGPTELWESSIKPFIIKSSSKLQLLDLQLPFEYGTLIEALESTPSLVKLYLTDRSTSGRFDFHSFLVHLADTCITPEDPDKGGLSQAFLPRLDSISFLGHINFISNNKPAFTAILDAFGPLSELGNPASRPLRHVVVEARNFAQIHMSKKDLRRFIALSDAGIRLQVIDPRSGKDVMLTHLPPRSS